MNIQKYTPQSLEVFKESLSPSEIKIFEIYSQPNIRNVETKQFKNVLNDAISICYFDLGIKKPTTDEELQARAQDIHTLIISVLQELQSDPFYNSLRLPEISRAIKNGSLGKYNDAKWSFIGISTANIITSIRKYMEDHTRNSNVTEYLKLTQKTENSNRPTEIELRKIVRDNIIRSFSLFKKKGWFDDPGNMIYHELYKLGHLNFSDSIIKGFYFKAKERLLKQYDYKQVLDKFKRAELRKRFEELTILEGASILEDKEIQIEVCRVALNHFFSQVSEMDMLIEDIISVE